MSARRIALVFLLGLHALLVGCATVSAGADPRDPWEGYNRQVWRFNEALDQTVLQPVARGYQAAVPEIVRVGVGKCMDCDEAQRRVQQNFSGPEVIHWCGGGVGG